MRFVSISVFALFVCLFFVFSFPLSFFCFMDNLNVKVFILMFDAVFFFPFLWYIGKLENWFSLTFFFLTGKRQTYDLNVFSLFELILSFF